MIPFALPVASSRIPRNPTSLAVFSLVVTMTLCANRGVR